jgi:hypothetical protein
MISKQAVSILITGLILLGLAPVSYMVMGHGLSYLLCLMGAFSTGMATVMAMVDIRDHA